VSHTRFPHPSRFRPLAAALLAVVPGCAPTGPGPGPDRAGFGVLVFSRTAGFRHDSIETGLEAIRGLGATSGFHVQATEDSKIFNDAGLAPFAAVVFLSTTGDVLDFAQQAAFERFIRRGGGYVGIHAAADTEYDWPWYGRLVGAYFKSHPAIQEATIVVADRVHPSTRMLPLRWTRTDEWYCFRANPRGAVHVLAVLDERTYEGGGMGHDHPIAWCHEVDGGRAWYTGGGHTKESFREPLFLEHVLGGIRWAAGAVAGDAGATVFQDPLTPALSPSPQPSPGGRGSGGLPLLPSIPLVP